MKSIAIKGSKRESVGKKSTRALRNAEMVPCVLYGGSEKVIHFSALEKDFNGLVYTPDVHTVKLNIDGTEVNAVLQDIQFHPVTDAILHMDFYQFNDESPITMTLPVHTTGVAKGTKTGGVLQFNMRRMDIRGLVSKMPDFIEVDITNLGIGDKLHISEITNDDYEILHDDDEAVCLVIAPRNLVVAADEEGEGEGEEAAEAPAEN